MNSNDERPWEGVVGLGGKGDRPVFNNSAPLISLFIF